MIITSKRMAIVLVVATIVAVSFNMVVRTNPHLRPISRAVRTGERLSPLQKQNQPVPDPIRREEIEETGGNENQQVDNQLKNQIDQLVADAQINSDSIKWKQRRTHARIDDGVSNSGTTVSEGIFANSFSAPDKKVISYSFYGGDSDRYANGLLANANALEKEFPGWHMYIYHDDTAATHVLKAANSVSKFIHVIDVAKQASMAGVSNRMSWRFLPLEDSTVERFIARDCDSRLTARDKATVDAWVASGKKFHVVRDHPSHSNFPMSGGMWGAVRGALPNIGKMLRSQGSDAYLADMNFLTKDIWPIAQKSLIQHDAFSCERFGGGLPVPHVRQGGEHLGGVYVNNQLRSLDVAILLKAQRPEKCTPPEEYKSYGGHGPRVITKRACNCADGFGSTYCDMDNGRGALPNGCGHHCKKGPGGHNEKGVCIAY